LGQKRSPETPGKIEDTSEKERSAPVGNFPPKWKGPACFNRPIASKKDLLAMPKKTGGEGKGGVMRSCESIPGYDGGFSSRGIFAWNGIGQPIHAKKGGVLDLGSMPRQNPGASKPFVNAKRGPANHWERDTQTRKGGNCSRLGQ